MPISSLSWTEIWDFLKSHYDVIDDVIITKIMVFDTICYDDQDSVYKYKPAFHFATTQYGHQMRFLILEIESETEFLAAVIT